MRLDIGDEAGEADESQRLHFEREDVNWVRGLWMRMLLVTAGTHAENSTGLDFLL